VSGPGGLASFLRREQLGARLAGPSLPLDVGYSDDVPAAIRNAVKLRDKFCQWVGGCHQPAAACEVHHLRHKGRGGQTSLENCLLLCSPPRRHPQDGLDPGPPPRRTTTAWNRDKSKVLRSHSPPARAG
jgi:5-methylcytosine-specific restriction endonuclease McrA